MSKIEGAAAGAAAVAITEAGLAGLGKAGFLTACFQTWVTGHGVIDYNVGIVPMEYFAATALAEGTFYGVAMFAWNLVSGNRQGPHI